MPVTISRAQRDAIYELVINHLTAIGDDKVSRETLVTASASKLREPAPVGAPASAHLEAGAVRVCPDGPQPGPRPLERRAYGPAVLELQLLDASPDAGPIRLGEDLAVEAKEVADAPQPLRIAADADVPVERQRSAPGAGSRHGAEDRAGGRARNDAEQGWRRPPTARRRAPASRGTRARAHVVRDRRRRRAPGRAALPAALLDRTRRREPAAQWQGIATATPASQMRPPRASTIARAIASLSPACPSVRDACLPPCTKGSNTSVCSRRSMPSPVSPPRSRRHRPPALPVP